MIHTTNLKFGIDERHVQRAAKAKDISIALMAVALVITLFFVLWEVNTVDTMQDVEYGAQPVNIDKALESGGLRLGN